MIKVNLSALTHAKVGTRSSTVLDLGHVVVSDIELAFLRGTLEFTRVDNGILVQGILDSAVKTECIRCLTPFFSPIQIELEDVISLPGSELTSEQPVRVHEDGWVDFSPLIRQYAWVNLPLNPVCSPDCQGLCPVCGGNRNLGECHCDTEPSIDPRWSVLKELKDSVSP